MKQMYTYIYDISKRDDEIIFVVMMAKSSNTTQFPNISYFYPLNKLTTHEN